MGRRSLVDGLKSRQKADRQKEEAFVFRKEEEPQPPARRPESAPVKTAGRGGEKTPPSPPALVMQQALAGRVPLTTRIRPKFATALKRASLERQLAGEVPSTVQDILELVLEPWLKDNGYLKE